MSVIDLSLEHSVPALPKCLYMGWQYTCDTKSCEVLSKTTPFSSVVPQASLVHMIEKKIVPMSLDRNDN